MSKLESIDKKAIGVNPDLFFQIKELICESKNQIISQVNTTITRTYFEIGKIIVESEQQGKAKAEYGKNTLKSLSLKLIEEFGSGFSTQNLERMRLFYLTFKKSSTLSRKLSWSHYVRLLSFSDQPLKLQFYIAETELNSWSLRELNRQIGSNYFDMEEKLQAENSTIGLILCPEKDKAIVKYVLNNKSAIFASEYRLIMPNEKQLRKIIETSKSQLNYQ